jgi:hypothetical protein
MEIEFLEKAIQNTLDHPGNMLSETSKDLLETCLTNLKLKTEIRVYLINIEDEKLEDVEVINFTDEEFIAEAERQGKVFTLNNFQNAFNEITYGVSQAVDVVRFIEVTI